ncbi:hypothetical protein LEP1GSC188_4608 [Leptospira weilii serovar Topaz str. LT2116]|uniref:Uncharacterized protein n=1 Tax=Leptospira weilii serovar Topaz str. LT2116 TaxID=1088540 RepID=M3EQI0_9LEPT|nr:hypothetical protein LEP1GSC188_4608 [Leptospira weilii serovar Topaz str. LT2116]
MLDKSVLDSALNWKKFLEIGNLFLLKFLQKWCAEKKKS